MVWLVLFIVVKSAILDAWRGKVAADLCDGEGFQGGPLPDIYGSMQLNSAHVRERDKALLGGVMVGGGVWNGYLLVRVRDQSVPCPFCAAPDNDGHLFGNAPFLLLLRCAKILNFTIL